MIVLAPFAPRRPAWCCGAGEAVVDHLPAPQRPAGIVEELDQTFHSRRSGRHAAVLLADGRVLIVGGDTAFSGETSLASAEIFDPAALTVTKVGNLGVARERPAISLLSDRLRGGGPLVGTWPTDDRGLSRAERKEVQALLTRRGYDWTTRHEGQAGTTGDAD